jgi:hypothetical protein
MMSLIVLHIGIATVSTPIWQPDPSSPKLTMAQLREEAVQCVKLLSQFEIVRRDFFPDGLEKVAPDERPWPPPGSYSWRVAVLPLLEQAGLYDSWLRDGSDNFRVPATLSDEELKKYPLLKRGVDMMPDWLTLKRWEGRTGQSIYRRVRIEGHPELFVIVESSDLAPWIKANDDLTLADGKPLPKMGGNFPNGFFALCGDGQVRFLPTGLADKEIRRALVSGGGIKSIDPNKAMWKQDIDSINFNKSK